MADVHPDVRAKLIDAAGQIFSEVGFAKATVRAICERAGVNVASVNYYFRDKLSLYQEVFHASLRDAGLNGLDESVQSLKSPEEQLRHFIRTYVHGVLGRSQPGRLIKLMVHELSHPTPALSGVIEHTIRPNERRLRHIVAAILKRSVDDEQTRLCTHSIIGQCLHYVHARHVLAHLYPQAWPPTPEQIDRLAQHIADFSLAALTHLPCPYPSSDAS